MSERKWHIVANIVRKPRWKKMNEPLGSTAKQKINQHAACTAATSLIEQRRVCFNTGVA